LKRGSVFIVMSDFVLVPLSSKTRQMLVAGKARNPVDDWMRDFADRAFDPIDILLQVVATNGAAQL
jgi:hypothetical protein